MDSVSPMKKSGPCWGPRLCRPMELQICAPLVSFLRQCQLISEELSQTDSEILGVRGGAPTSGAVGWSWLNFILSNLF